jgi:hypothetical protein
VASVFVEADEEDEDVDDDPGSLDPDDPPSDDGVVGVELDPPSDGAAEEPEEPEPDEDEDRLSFL